MTDLFEAGDQTASKREELLNKWKDKSKEELLEAKINSDLFVDTLTKRQDDISRDYLEAKKQIDAQASLQELVDRLNAQQTSTSSTATNANEEKPRIEQKDIESIVLKQIQENKLSEKRTANGLEVQNKLREKFGDKSSSILREQAQALGLTQERVNELAQESPAAFFRLMGLEQTQLESFQTPPRNNQRNDNFAPKGQTKRDWNYYQELKKTNPTLYLDRKIAIQMHNDVLEQGEVGFYGSNL